MRRILAAIIFVILLISVASAEIIITEQPKDIYNIGGIIKLPITVKSVIDTAGILEVFLLCQGEEINFYRNGIWLTAGEEVRIEPVIILNKQMIGELTGKCAIKAALGEEYALTKEFSISNLIILTKTSEASEFRPGSAITIQGTAVKENGIKSQGFIDMQIMLAENTSLDYQETIKNGFFSINSTLPDDLAAGQYLIRLKAYEKNANGEIINSGSLDMNVRVTQVSTSLEILFDRPEIEPGTNFRAKIILHDQTGVNIQSSSYVTIRNSDNKILEQMSNITNDEFFDYPVPRNEPPSEWRLEAESNNIKTEGKFKILKKEQVDILLLNKTLTITNIGNVPYNKTVLVKIGNQSLNVDVNLEVDESRKYQIKAPDGNYEVEIMTEEGSKLTGLATLSGKEFTIKEAKSGFAELIARPLVWIFMILIFGVAAFFLFKKVRKKTFFGFITKKKPSSPREDSAIQRTGSKAELSLAIKGEKQSASIICLKLKNELKDKNIIQAITNLAEAAKAATYESQDNLFFIFAPVRTRTFKNEAAALRVAEEIKELLKNYNSRAKEKLDFGISLNYGAIVAKQENTLKFMSMGTLMTIAKKIAALSKQEILLSESMAPRLSEYAKTEKHKKQGTIVSTIKQIKDSEANKKFISNFLDRIEKN